VLFRGHGHEAVRGECARIDARGKLPYLPAVIVFGDRETKGVGGFGVGEGFVAPFAGEKSRKISVIGLADDDDGIVLLKDQDFALCRKY